MTLHRYILRQLLVGLTFAVGGMVLIAIPGLAINAVHTLGGTGAGALFKYLPLVGAELVPYLVPMGYLLATVATFGRLAADGEWTAICMAGFLPVGLLVAPLVVALGLGVGTLWIASEVSPDLKFRQRELIKNSLVDSFKSLNRGRTDLTLGDFQLISQYRDDSEEAVFRDVFIQIPEMDDFEAASILADRAHLWLKGENTIVVELFRWRAVLRSAEEVGEDSRVGQIRLAELQVELPLDELFEVERSKSHRPKYRRSSAILASLRAGELTPRQLRKSIIELHERGALAFTYLTFLLLGVPTGLLLRKGTQLGAMAAAVGYGLAYYLLSMRIGEELGAQDVVPAWAAAWATNILGLGVGLFLAWRAFRR